MALRGVGPECEAESLRFHWRRVTKVGPEVKHGLSHIRANSKNWLRRDGTGYFAAWLPRCADIGFYLVDSASQAFSLDVVRPRNVFASMDLVVSLFRNYASYATARIRIVTLPTRNEVNMTVHYRLTSNRATVDSNVET